MGRHKSLLMWRARKTQRYKEGEKTSVARVRCWTMGFTQHTLLIHFLTSSFPSWPRRNMDLEHYRLAQATLAPLEGPLKHSRPFVFYRDFFRHSGSALESVLDCVLKRGISSCLLPSDVIMPPPSPPPPHPVYQACVPAASMWPHLALSSGVDMLQRRLLSILLRVVRERPVWADQSTVTGSLLHSCVKHNQASVEWRCNKCLNGRDGSGSPTPLWLIVPDVLTQRSKNSTLRMKFCGLPESDPFLVTFP